jgi:hypothetical protein
MRATFIRGWAVWYAAAAWAAFILLGCIAGCGGSGGGGPAPTATRGLPTATAVPTVTPSIPSPLTPSATPSGSTVATATRTATPTLTLTAMGTATETPTVQATPNPTATPLVGPVVTAFGVADASGTFNASAGEDDLQRPIFARDSSTGFVIYIEGRPGMSRLPVGTGRLNAKPGDPTRQPDLQMESSADLGDASPAVCDGSFPTLGGVPGISTPDFSAVQPVSDALNDMGCRFRVFAETDFACTQDASANLRFDNPSSTIQFCTLVDEALPFPVGDTVLTARLRDTAGNAGPPAQIVVRIAAR